MAEWQAPGCFDRHMPCVLKRIAGGTTWPHTRADVELESTQSRPRRIARLRPPRLTGHAPVAGSNPLVVRDSTLACRAVACVHDTSRLDKQQLDFCVCTGLVLDSLRNDSQLSGTSYHDALQEELTRLRSQHRNVLLWEAHSIASVLPRLFEGKLPDFNIGTQDGRTAAPSVQEAIQRVAAASPFTWIANGRFKGGFITRHAGAPQDGVHAVQLEMCQSTYMSENAPFHYLPEVAKKVEPVVRGMVNGALDAIVKLTANASRAK